MHRQVTFTTGVAGRAAVLTEDDELLFGATVGEAGGIEAGLPLLAPLAPLAAPKQTDSKGIAFQEGGGGFHDAAYIQCSLPFLASMNFS